MKNFPVKVDGNEYWISRSIAVVTYVFTLIDGVPHVLANKRGPGLPNNVGKWNAPSGFLDYDEDLDHAAMREVFEETGVKIYWAHLNLLEVDSSPLRPNQVVLVRYYATYEGDPNVITNKYCEPNEVDEVKWIPISEIDNYEWSSDAHILALRRSFERIENKL